MRYLNRFSYVGFPLIWGCMVSTLSSICLVFLLLGLGMRVILFGYLGTKSRFFSFLMRSARWSSSLLACGT